MHDMTDIVTSGEIFMRSPRGKYFSISICEYLLPCHTDTAGDCTAHNRMYSVICFDTRHPAHSRLPMTLVTHSDPYKIFPSFRSQFSAKLKLTEQ